MYQLKKFLNKLEHHELLHLRKQLESGNLDLEKEVKEKIKVHERMHAQQCATCSGLLDPTNTNNYTLLLGPDDFKKKASFCGLDCLEYFMGHIKQLKEGENHEKVF